MLTGADYDISSSELLERLRWKHLETQHRSNKAVLVDNILNNGTAPCLRESFSLRSVNENEYNLRNYYTDLSILRPKKEALKRSLNIEERCYGTVYRVKLKLLNRLMVLKGLYMI